MRILFLSGWFPYPPSNGSKLRIYNLLRALAPNHEVTLLSFADDAAAPAIAPALHALCTRVEVVPWKPFQPRSSRLALMSRTPRSLVDTFSPEMAARITRTLSGGGYDVVVASQMALASYVRCFRGLPALFEEVEIGVLYEQFAHARSPWRRLRHGFTWAKQRRYLARVLRDFRACTVVSERERHLLSLAVPSYKAIEVIPNAVDLIDYAAVPGSPEPNTVIFTGSLRFSANYDGMVWFLRNVLPHIQAEKPEVRLTITGAPADRPLPPAGNVLLTGFVDDVRPLIASSWVSVAPILAGGGTRLKILEAMALGTPVVATAKGAEGLAVVHGEHLLIANEPQVFARHVVDLLSNSDLRQVLACNARRLVEERYDWRLIGPRFAELVAETAR